MITQEQFEEFLALKHEIPGIESKVQVAERIIHF
jgi:hypothetical protein